MNREQTRAKVREMLGPDGVKDLEAFRERFGAKLLGITDGVQTIGDIWRVKDETGRAEKDRGRD